MHQVAVRIIALKDGLAEQCRVRCDYPQGTGVAQRICRPIEDNVQHATRTAESHAGGGIVPKATNVQRWLAGQELPPGDREALHCGPAWGYGIGDGRERAIARSMLVTTGQYNDQGYKTAGTVRGMNSDSSARTNTRASPAWRGAEQRPVGQSWPNLSLKQDGGRATSGACAS
jgi:hypothetical protein